ncbi:hypothetical protein [Plesiocystis pacifica]|nr:hypothetical protein [Plesiocystis pacifica]
MTGSHDNSPSQEPSDSERRLSGRRARARDRLMDRASSDYAPSSAVAKMKHIENLLLFIDDDLRETALSMERIERYLISTLDILEGQRIDGTKVQELATDVSVLDQVDLLNESLESLRRRMARLASAVG